MIGRSYYVTTIQNWKSQLGQLNGSHWLVIDDTVEDPTIIVLISADENVHRSLQSSMGWTILPHPMSGNSIGVELAASLSKYGLNENSTTFDVANILQSISPVMGLNGF